MSTLNSDFFAGLPENDLEDAINGPKDLTKIEALPAPVFMDRCPKCKGRGYFTSYSGRILGNCFACKGKGQKAYKTSSEDRADNRQKVEARKAKSAAENLEAFKIAHPAIWAWMDGSTFPFAVSMREAIAKFGDLTEKQFAAASSSAEKLAAAKQASVDRVANAKAVDTSKIEIAFSRASSKLGNPKLRLAGMEISHAKAASKNAGALYVKAGATYLGKIMNGKFQRSRDCTDEDETKLLEIASDPLAAAIAYGRLTGSCACCGRALTNQDSVERGIGPICAETFGW